MKEYFLYFVSTNKGQEEVQNAKYQTIFKYLKDKLVKCVVSFLVSSPCIFSRISGLFQKEDTMINSLYRLLKCHVLRISGRIYIAMKSLLKYLLKLFIDNNNMFLSAQKSFNYTHKYNVIQFNMITQ